MYRYEYITLLDTDEVIVPTNHTNWSDLMKNLVFLYCGLRGYKFQMKKLSSSLYLTLVGSILLLINQVMNI